MTFHVGDKVRALPNSYYSITNNGWIGYVIQVISQSRIRVSANKNGRDDVYEVRANCFELVETDVKEKEEINMVNVSEIINDEERKVLLEDMKGLLSEYDYQYTEEALNKIIDTWATNKADLITAIKKHPNYLQGKFMIVFSHNFDRTVDKTAINGFKKWLLNSETCFAVREFMTE